MVYVQVKYDNSQFIQNMGERLKLASMTGINKLSKEVKQFAIDDYTFKRKSPTPIGSSRIVASFFTIPAQYIGNGIVQGHVVAGGPIAPHIVYVEFKHPTKNHKGTFEGYYFMKKATEEGGKIAESIMTDELSKIF